MDNNNKGGFRRLGRQQRAEHCLLTLDMAVYHAAHDYAGGPAAIAVQHGLSPATLQNKINPNLQSHQVNLRDLQAICVSTQDPRILRTICSWYHAGYFILPDAEASTDELFAQGAELAREMGELMADVHDSLRDGHITEDEVARLENSLQELFTAARALVEVAKREGGFDGRR